MAKEAMLVELFRQDRLSHQELSQALGFDDSSRPMAVLKKHHVTEDLPNDKNMKRLLPASLHRQISDRRLRHHPAELPGAHRND